jgi:concanavalin A-like lectin/glucanase superfamily protein
MAEQMLQTCMTNLGRIAPSAGSGIPATYTSEGCVSLPRIFTALGYATRNTRGGSAPYDQRGSKLLQRILQGWAQVSGFVAREGMEEAGHAKVLDSLSPSDGDAPLTATEQVVANNAPSLTTLLDQLEKNWMVFLDGDIAPTLQQIPAAQLATPDYRRGREPLGYWRLDETDGVNQVQTIADQMGRYPLTGVLWDQNCLSWNANNPAWATGQTCFLYGTFPHLPGNMTISFWADSDPEDTEFPSPPDKREETLFDVGTTRIKYNWQVNSMRVSHGTAGGGTVTVDLLFGAQGPFGRNYAIVRDVGLHRYQLYVNGVLKDTKIYGAGNDPITPTWQGQINIGWHSSDSRYNFNGTLDEVAVWDSVLAQPQIAAISTRKQQNAPRPAWPTDIVIGTPADAVGWEAPIGLPVSMVESLSSYLRLVEAYLVEVGEAHQSDCMEGLGQSAMVAAQVRAARALRVTNAVEQLARSLKTRAGTVDWGTRWEKALTEVDNARARAARTMMALPECRAAMNLSKSDIPLYFDANNAPDKFFAGSKSLETEVVPAIDAAKGAFTAARTAARQQFESKVQQQIGDTNIAGRKSEIRKTHGSVLVDLCGLGDMDAEQAYNDAVAGTLDPSICYLKPITACAGAAELPLASIEPSCFRGQLGEAMVGVKNATIRIERATAGWTEATSAANTWDEYCAKEQDEVELSTKMIEHYKQAAIKDYEISHTLGVIGSFGKFIKGGFTLNGGDMLEGGLGGLQQDCSLMMATRRIAHEALMAKRQLQGQLRACWNSAALAGLAVPPAESEILVAQGEAVGAVVRFQDLITKAKQAVIEGSAALAREELKVRPQLAFHYWADEELNLFTRRFARARRLVYLYARMVEYDLQKSFGLYDAILQARHPEQLRDIYLTLHSYVGPQGVDGRQPTELFRTVSLRDQVLGLSDPELFPGEDPSWTPEQRLRNRFMARSSAVYDRTTGEYKGQGIRFVLSPENLNLPDRCIERAWRFNLQWTTAGGTATTAEMRLFKRETFASRTCADRVDEMGPFQTVSLRPGGNLFIEGNSTSTFGVERDYTSGLITSRQNEGVDGLAFLHDDHYTNGSTVELAGRGVFGEYILVITKQAMAAGFDPSRLNQLYLRVDYVSVDDPGDVGN